ALQEPAVVERLPAGVDPPEAEGALEHFRVADALDSSSLLGDLDPDPRRGVMVGLEPLLPLARGSKRDSRGRFVPGLFLPLPAPAPAGDKSASGVSGRFQQVRRPLSLRGGPDQTPQSIP